MEKLYLVGSVLHDLDPLALGGLLETVFGNHVELPNLVLQTGLITLSLAFKT